MENQKLILVFAVVILLLPLILAFNTFSNKEMKSIVMNCSKECQINKNEMQKECVSNHFNETRVCKEDFQECITNVKNQIRELKNSSNNTEINKNITKDFANKMVNCSKTQLKCLKTYDLERKSCQKNVSIIKCNEQCYQKTCLSFVSPVCGKDNNTYSNECLLNNAKVKKSCNGECPCNTTSIVPQKCKNYYIADALKNRCNVEKICNTTNLSVFNTKKDCLNSFNISKEISCTTSSDCPQPNCINCPHYICINKTCTAIKSSEQ